MNDYNRFAYFEMGKWQHQVSRQPGFIDNATHRLQVKLNSYIPEKVHAAITTTIKQMCRLVIFGAGMVPQKATGQLTLEQRELAVLQKIKVYKRTAAAEGGVTGAGGILLGLADFPLLLGIKIKLLFDIAALYGFDTNDYRERVYLLYIFQLAFSSQHNRRQVFEHLRNWEAESATLPNDIHQFNWRTFQQEYRDYLDLAKMAQMIPLVGAPVGIIVNYRLIKKLGNTAMNAYRMRLFTKNELGHIPLLSNG